MESRYIWAIVILVVWIALRLFLMHRRKAQIERWQNERAAEDAREAQEQGGDGAAALDTKDDANPPKP